MSDQENKSFALDKKHLDILELIKVELEEFPPRSNWFGHDKGDYINEIELVDTLKKFIEDPPSVGEDKLEKYVHAIIRYNKNYNLFENRSRLSDIVGRKTATLDGNKLSNKPFAALREDLLLIEKKLLFNKLNKKDSKYFGDTTDHIRLLKALEQATQQTDESLFSAEIGKQRFINVIKKMRELINEPSIYKDKDAQEALAIFITRPGNKDYNDFWHKGVLNKLWEKKDKNKVMAPLLKLYRDLKEFISVADINTERIMSDLAKKHEGSAPKPVSSQPSNDIPVVKTPKMNNKALHDAIKKHAETMLMKQKAVLNYSLEKLEKSDAVAFLKEFISLLKGVDLDKETEMASTMLRFIMKSAAEKIVRQKHPDITDKDEIEKKRDSLYNKKLSLHKDNILKFFKQVTGEKDNKNIVLRK